MIVTGFSGGAVLALVTADLEFDATAGAVALTPQVTRPSITSPDIAQTYSRVANTVGATSLDPVGKVTMPPPAIDDLPVAGMFADRAEVELAALGQMPALALPPTPESRWDAGASVGVPVGVQTVLNKNDRVGRSLTTRTIDYLLHAPLELEIALPAPAWRRFKQDVPTPSGERPRIAIVVDDVGLSRTLARQAIDLDPAVTLSFLPYARHVNSLAAAARDAGHEILVHMPMEPYGDKDPGPNALLVDLGDSEIIRRMRWALDRVPGEVGLNNHMGSRFTSTPQAMQLIMGELHARGLMFLDSRTAPKSVAHDVANDMNVAVAGRHVFLDNEQNEANILAQLYETERHAKRYGRAVALCHPYPMTLRVLRSWISGVRERGFDLVPITAVAKVDESRPWVAQSTALGPETFKQ